MKLIKCYVSSFGKLKGFSYDFNQGLNIINHDNGWGKSTLATFIKAMFYGLNSSKHSIAENERKKYRPWNSTEKFGGFVEFEWGNNSYKIERFFGTKESEDTIRLFDTKTGKEYSNTDNLGKRIFEIDEEGFLSTTFFSQKDFQIKSNSSLTAKYNSLCEFEDSKDYDSAIEKLDSKIKKYKIRGDKGLIADTKREIYQLENEIQSTNKSAQIFNEIKVEVAHLESQVSALNKHIAEKTKQISTVSEQEILKIKRDNYNKLCAERQQLITQLESTENLLSKNTTSQEEINHYLTSNNDLLTAKTNIDILSADIENLKQLNIPSKQDKKPSMWLIYVAILCALVGVGMAFVNYLITIPFVALGVVFGSIWYFSKPKSVSTNQASYLGIIAKKQEELNKYIILKNNIEITIDNFISKFSIGEYQDRFSALNKILTLSNEYEKTKKLLEDIEQYISDYAIEKVNFTKLDDESKESLSDLKSALGKMQAEFNDLSTRLANKKASLVYHQNLASNTLELESAKAELEHKLKSYCDDFETYSTTLELLKRADENLKVKYKAPLQESLNKYISKISDSEMDAQIDIDLNVVVMEKGGGKDTDFYSKGYQNLIEICKRFALTDVLFKGEKPFIILDDPFYNLDEIKIKNAVKLIKELSDEYQIIYFICHSSRGSDEI